MVMSKDLLERLFWDGERFFWLRSWIIGREPGKPVYLRPGIMSQCHVCCAYDSPSTFGPLRICHHWMEKKQDRRPASADFKCYIHTCIGAVLFITCFSNHWSWASLNLLPLMYIFSTLLSFSVKVLREYLIDFFFQKHSSISLTLTSSWGKTLYEELPVNIWHPKGICSWCELWGKQRLLRCLCLALTAKQNGARKIRLFPWTRKQKQSADFFFWGRPQAFSRWGTQTHLITQFEKSWGSAWDPQEPNCHHHLGWVSVWRGSGQPFREWSDRKVTPVCRGESWELRWHKGAETGEHHSRNRKSQRKNGELSAMESSGKNCSQLPGFQGMDWNDRHEQLGDDKEFTSCVWNSHLLQTVILMILCKFSQFGASGGGGSTILPCICCMAISKLRAPVVYKLPWHYAKCVADVRSYNNHLTCISVCNASLLTSF